MTDKQISKYIVKNCPASCFQNYCEECQEYCQDCTNCLIKQVIEKCREEENWVNCSNNKPTETAKFAQEILQLFAIEEQQ